MSVAFWGGLIPLLPFIIAICIGGTAGEAISLFLYKQYYPWVIALASISVLIGLIAMYVGKKEALSTKSFSKKTQKQLTPAEGEDSVGRDASETDLKSEK